MNDNWMKLFRKLQKHLVECRHGTVGLVFDIHAGKIAKIHFQHDERFIDFSEVPDDSK